MVQLGGQTPLKLALPLFEAGVPIVGTSPQSIDLAEDRKRFERLLRDLDITRPENGTALSIEQARKIGRRIGYPLLVRPSYVLGGRAMAIVYDEASLDGYVNSAVDVSPQRPILIDKFLEDAREYDVDALADGENVIIAGIMEHIEEAGIHSGDSTSVLPPIIIEEEHLETMRDYTRRLGEALQVVGLMNIQFAVVEERVYVLEVNPRASRTIPFVSKATGIPLAKVGARAHDRKKALRAGTDAGSGRHQLLCEDPGLPLCQVSGRRHDPWDRKCGPRARSWGETSLLATLTPRLKPAPATTCPSPESSS